MAVSFHQLFLVSFLLLSLTSVQPSREFGTDYVDNYGNGNYGNGNYGNGRLSYGNVPLYGDSYSNIAPSAYHPEEDGNFRESLNDGYNLPTLNYAANYANNYAANYAANYEGLGRNYAGPYSNLYQNPLLGAIYGGPQPGYNALGSSNYGKNYPNVGSSYGNNYPNVGSSYGNNYPNAGSSYGNSGASYGAGVGYPSAKAGYPSADLNYASNPLLGKNYASAGATYPSTLNSYDNSVTDYGSIGGSYSPSYGSGSLAVNPLVAGVPGSYSPSYGSGSLAVNPLVAGVPLSPGYRTGANYPQVNPLRSLEYGVGLNNPLAGANNYANGVGYSQPNPVVAAEVYNPSVPLQNGELYNPGYNPYPRIQPLYVPTPCSGLGAAVNASFCCSGTNGRIDDSGINKCCLTAGTSCSGAPDKCCNGQLCKQIGNPAAGVYVCADPSHVEAGSYVGLGR